MNIEIEKKYIIKKPSLSDMEAQADYRAIDITQIYLSSPKGVTHRIRAACISGEGRYYETKKIRIDKMSSYEDEREITKDEFLTLSARIEDGTRPIKKVRHAFSYLGETFEIDIYPEWNNTCIMETELDTRERVVKMPDFIEIVKDVTGKHEYSNYSMSHSFPKEAYL